MAQSRSRHSRHSSPYMRRLSLAHLQRLEQFARSMRGAPTHSEEALWRLIRGSRLGVRFVAQAVIAETFIVDFLCRSLRLVVEVDGLYHLQRTAQDAYRDDLLRALGYRVLRIEAAVVEKQPQQALALIRQAIALGPAQ